MTKWRRFRCWMGWHSPDHTKRLDPTGFQMLATCCGCGKEIIQDSQGNWF